MDYIELINNRNLKELLKKNYLTEETVREIKTSLFIHPAKLNKDGSYTLNPNDNEEIQLFTSLEEYNNMYSQNAEFTPFYFYFDEFPYCENTKGTIINPETDKLFIPASLCFHIIEDMEETNRTIEFKNSIKSERPNYLQDFLNEYLENKTKITYISKLFYILDKSTVYSLISSEDSLDEYIKDNKISNDDVDFNLVKKDNYIVIFTSKNEFKSMMEPNMHYYYVIADMIEIIKIIFELDYEGIILKAPEREFELKRHRLLKYWDNIVEDYGAYDDPLGYAFKIMEE